MQLSFFVCSFAFLPCQKIGDAQEFALPPANELAGLRTTVEELVQHVRLLSCAVDDLMTELQWRNTNCGKVLPRRSQ